jgi:hypothetical protein
MTIPLLEYYAGREWMFVVNGAQPPADVHSDIVRRLGQLAAFSRRGDAAPDMRASRSAQGDAQG